MKALVYTKMGDPHVLKLEDEAVPTVKADEVLIKVMASSVNATDIAPFEPAVRSGKIKTAFRLKEKLKDHKVGKILGIEVSGIIEATGTKVTTLRKGDAVYGIVSGMLGAWAEYAVAEENMVALKPENISFGEAAAIPVAGITALAAIRKTDISPRQKVLVYGASGGVGLSVLQLLKYYGAEVTALCSTRNVETAWKQGADHVIDYRKEDVFSSGLRYDVIIAVNGYNPISKYGHILTAKGKYVAVGGPAQGLMGALCGPILSIFSKKKFTFSIFYTEIKKHCMEELNKAAESGYLRPFIEAECTLEEVPEVIERLIINHAKGKTVIRIGF